jgi:SAM-dependent methyltransferase
VAWDGNDYQRRFDALAAAGRDVHGEADFVMSFSPATVLDAGCGTGRVAIELARRGVEVLGVDRDASMLATARRLAPQLTWIEADLMELDLGRAFDLVVLAGNVPLFTAPGTAGALVERCASHVAPGSVLVAGFQLGREVSLVEYDAATARAGVMFSERFATWDREPYVEGGAYAVTVSRRLP